MATNLPIVLSEKTLMTATMKPTIKHDLKTGVPVAVTYYVTRGDYSALTSKARLQPSQMIAQDCNKACNRYKTNGI